MNSIVKKLIRNSTILRNTITLSYYNTATSVNFQKGNLGNYRITSNDEKYNAQIMPLSSENHLKAYFKSIKENYKNMDLDKAMQCFNELLQVADKMKGQNMMFTKYDGFEELCNVVLKNAIYLDINKLNHLIYILKTFKIPHSSMLLHTLFQLVRSNLNILNMKQIISLYRLLSDYNNSRFVKKILLGLKLTFEQKALLELDPENKHLMSALRFSTIIECRTVKDYIIEILLKNPTYISMDNIKDIYYELEYVGQTKRYDQNLRIVKDFICKNAEDMSEEDIVHIISFIKEWHSEIFIEEFDMLVDYMIIRKATLDRKLEMLSHFNRLKFRNTALLESISHEILGDSHMLKVEGTHSLSTLMRSFVISNYKPCNWDILVQALENSLTKTLIWPLPRLIESAYQLLSLDHYSPALLAMVFRSCNDSLKTTPYEMYMARACKLHWCVKLLYPTYDGVMLKEEILTQTTMHQTEQSIFKRTFKGLEESVMEIVRDNIHVLHKFKSRVLQTVDLVVAIRPDGSFVDLSKENVNFVDELESIPDCDKILIYGLPKHAYCVNTKKLFSTLNMQRKAMESYPGFHTILIDPFTWSRLSINDQVETIQKAINATCAKV